MSASVAERAAESAAADPALAGANPDGHSRPTETYVDGLRAVAVVCVLVLHAWGISSSPNIRILGHSVTFLIARGAWGVDLFFVLSGFLLARPWFEAELTGRPRPSVRTYARRRFRRIVPAYVVSLAVLFAVFVPSHVVPAAAVTGRIGFWNIAAHLTFLQHIFPLSATDFGVNGVYWTLTMEVLFYLCLPIMVRAFVGRRAGLAIASALVVSAGWVWLSLRSFGPLVRTLAGSVSGHTGQVVGVPSSTGYMRAFLVVQFPSWLFTFALGILLARLVVRQRGGVGSPWCSPGIALAAIGLALTSLVWFAHEYFAVAPIGAGEPALPYVLDHILPGAAMALLVFGTTFGPAWVRRPLEIRPVRHVGQVSYGVYLYHLMVLTALLRYTTLFDRSPVGAFWLAISCGLGIAVLIATVSWYAIERPLLRGRARGARHAPRQRRWASIAVAGLAMPALGLVLGIADPSGAAPASPGALGTIRHAAQVAALSGPTSPDLAAARNLIYPHERDILSRCGAVQGSTEALSAATWGATGSVFTCRNASAAAVALAEIKRWEPAIGFTPSHLSIGAPTFVRVAADAEPRDPYRFHVRYRSGAQLVGISVSARTDSDGWRALSSIMSAARAVAPVSP